MFEGNHGAKMRSTQTITFPSSIPLYSHCRYYGASSSTPWAATRRISTKWKATQCADRFRGTTHRSCWRHGRYIPSQSFLAASATVDSSVTRLASVRSTPHPTPPPTGDGAVVWNGGGQEGRTGYPWIDAAMTQLRTEGWLHHLARHAVACFLTRGDLWQVLRSALRRTAMHKCRIVT